MRNRRMSPPTNSGSMADIAFLLLIFFLLTTTIFNDMGILVKLPRMIDQPVEWSSKNVFSVHINSADQILADGEVVEVTQVRSMTKDFILNPMQRDDRPSTPAKAVVSLQHDRSTTYETYLAVYNELQAAYNELWDAEAQHRFGKTFEALAAFEKKEIKNKIPLLISEAEPSDLK